ncbi:unnamed protein product [Candidula unifasciata]|uniref:Chitin-binding type-2 domain-containing protein n=1 Tax=Candidula unifasciata TaxID=100452 RepID=A0A8S3YZI3_9EUPU|nr:unnamed protein product [Candidula unifasciata]
MKQLMELSYVMLLLALAAVKADEDNDGGESSLVESCEQEDFYCDYEDPSVFYRCIDHVLHTFRCPSGLHFSAGTQTCDWPHVADCSGGEAASDSSSSQQSDSDDSSPSSEESQSGGIPNHSNIVSLDKDSVKASDDAGVSIQNSWINQAAAAGKSWWRPEGIKPHQWQDVSSIKKPDFKPHVPDKPKSEAESPPKPSEDDSPPQKSEDDSPPQKSEDDKPPQKSEDDSPLQKSEEESPRKKTDGKSSEESAPKKADPVSAQSAPAGKQESASVQWNEGSCSSSCQLPHCYCAGTSIPKDLPVKSVPQMVMLTFDDEVSAAFYGYYQRLFRPGRYNPNGCPIRGCLFVSGSGTNYDLVYPLYAMGVEIASHTISHRFPHTWWATASYQEFVDEAVGMRENLIKRSGIPRESVKGFRVPFLQLGSDNMYSALYDSKFVYDTSMFTGSQWEGGDPVWPFTLDYVPSNTHCQHGPCPTKQYPGMWEIPVQRWYGLDGHSCAMPDGCSSTGDAEETLEYLKSNFRRFYNSNRAPFGIFVHARWFNSEHNLEGLDRFIDYLLTLDDVYFVTPSQVIDWMKNPTPLSEINGFGPWSCQGGAKDN